VVAVIATAGCYGPVSRERLVGTYRVDYGYGLEQLTLKADGTYTQEFAEAGQGFHVINEDQFDLGTGDFWDDQLVTLHNPVIVDVSGTRSDMTRSSGVWPARVRRSCAGRPRLLINEDLGLEFERVESSK